MGFLLSSLILVHGLLLSGLLGDGSSLALLDFSHGFFGQSFLFFGSGILELFDVVKGHTFNGSLLSENFSLFIFASVSLF